MQPRSAIDFVLVDVDPAEASRTALRSGRTRLPVCRRESGIDGPLGLVHVYDLLAVALLRQTVELGELMRPLALVSERTPVTQLLARMRDERRHMVLVTDHRGITVGLIMLEDLLEELMAEIETDVGPPLQPRRVQVTLMD
jgi:magnesium and cobalt transporter